MTWVKLDDKFHRNHKQRAMSDHAFRLFILALSYCGDCPELTGFLTTAEMIGFARSHGKKPFVVDELVRRGFLEVVSDGFLIHDWEKFVPKTSTERVRKWREQKRSESVTETFHERSRNVSPLARTRRVPEPEPEPEPVTPPSSPPEGGGLLSDQAVAIVEWWCQKRGWQHVPPSKQERVYTQARALAGLGLEDPELIGILDEQWDEATEKPFSLTYFWQNTQDRSHEILKARKPATWSDGRSFRDLAAALRPSEVSNAQ